MQQRAEIIQQLKRFFIGEKEILFAYLHGSFLTGKKFNDIDIAVYLDEKIIRKVKPMDFEISLAFKIEDILHLPVDVRIINKAPIPFIFNVLKNGTLILDRDSTLRSDFEGLIFKKYFDFQHLRDEYLREILNAPI